MVDLEYPLAYGSVGLPLFFAGGEFDPNVGESDSNTSSKPRILLVNAKIQCVITINGTPYPSTGFSIPNGTATPIPWSVSFSTVPAGTYSTTATIEAKLSDNGGAYVVRDTAINITVGTQIIGDPQPGGLVVPMLPPP